MILPRFYPIFDSVSWLERALPLGVELVQLRIKDVDLDRGVVTVHQGKGDKDRETIIPNCLKEDLAKEIANARSCWEEDRKNGVPGVALPGALARKMPKAGAKWAWMWIFPADHLSKDPESGIIRRHHLHPKSYAEAIPFGSVPAISRFPDRDRAGIVHGGSPEWHFFERILVNSVGDVTGKSSPDPEVRDPCHCRLRARGRVRANWLVGCLGNGKARLRAA